MPSFVVPAHNEEQHIGPAVAAILAAGGTSGETFEVVVVDDASTDRTAGIAVAQGARAGRPARRPRLS